MLKEFQDFILKGNAFDLAVGVIIGTAFSAVVTSLVGDIIMPPLGAIMGGVDFSNYYVNLTTLMGAVTGDAKPAPASIKEAQDAGHAVIAYGKFLNTIINLLIVGGAIFLVVKQINRLRRTPTTPSEPAAIPEDVRLLAEIRDLLRGGPAPAPTPKAPPGGPKTPRR
ncbi:MAG: large conductance mechanosensitive channel protein MscL [Hyphomicrobiales bacterium]|nr:large conductance mechanosensitive channel protein MscL [Hyphomicrobiales bacterium]